MSSAISATASTTRRRCTPPTSASRSTAPSTSPRTRPTSSCSSSDLGVLERGVARGPAHLRQHHEVRDDGRPARTSGTCSPWPAPSLFLPFLPMLPVQILLNNLLYDLSEVPIPMDEVERERPSPPAPLGHALHPQLHAGAGSGQLAVRLPDLRPAAAASSTPAKRCSRPAGSSNRWRPRCWSSSSSGRGGNPLTQPAASAAGGDLARWSCCWRSLLPFTAARPLVRLRAAAGALLAAIVGLAVIYLLLAQGGEARALPAVSAERPRPVRAHAARSLPLTGPTRSAVWLDCAYLPARMRRARVCTKTNS